MNPEAASIRRFQLTLVGMLLLSPVLLWASVQCVQGMFNTPHLWIPETDPQRRDFELAVEQFESQALVVISWPGCTVDDPRLGQLTTALLESDQATGQASHTPLIDRVVTGYDVVRQLTSRPLELSRSEAVERLRGALVGPDGQTSCAVITFTERGGYQRQETISLILDVASRVCELPRDQFRLAGPPVDGVAIDRAGVDTMLRFALPSAIVAFLFCWWCLSDWRYALVILSAAVYGQGLCLSLVYFSGVTMNAILILMPPLVFVLTIAAGIHLVNYYYDEVLLHGVDQAPRRAMQNGWFPCVLASLTTAIGLGSLLISQIEPIRFFGLFSTLGVLGTLALLFLLLPGAMECFPQRHLRENRRSWQGWANSVIRFANPICVASLCLLCLLACGLLSLETSVKLRDLFTSRDPIVADYAWLESRLGPMVPVDIVLHFPPDSPVPFQDRIVLVQGVSQKMEELEEVDRVLSASTFALPRPSRGGMRAVVEQAVSRTRFTHARFRHEDAAGESWRLAARVPALSDLDYADFLKSLERRIAPTVDAFAKENDQAIEMTITGAIPLIYQTQRTLLADLIRSFVLAFAFVGLVLMFVLRSVGAGLLAMIPNLFPTIVVFGMMGWLQRPVDIGSVMTASIALGIAVVDTLHFLTWFRREVAAGKSPPAAIRKAYAHCATAMVQTSVVCSVGMLVFTLSSFVPASRFAWMVFILLFTALFADLVILPALLASPLGRLFARRFQSRVSLRES